MMLWKDLRNDDVAHNIYPHSMFLLHLLLIFPISIACVERLFSRMKLVKTRLRNQLKQTSLDALLRISTEAKDGFTDMEYELFVDELKRCNPNIKLSL